MNSAYDTDNIFAKILRGEMPSHKVFEDENTFVMLDIMPWADGHCLVLPKAPARNVLDISSQSLAAVAETTKRTALAVRKAMNADGVTIQQNNEAAGGQVVFHLHVHVIPRRDGERLKRDNGDMADQAQLAETARKIAAAFSEI